MAGRGISPSCHDCREAWRLFPTPSPKDGADRLDDDFLGDDFLDDDLALALAFAGRVAEWPEAARLARTSHRSAIVSRRALSAKIGVFLASRMHWAALSRNSSALVTPGPRVCAPAP